MTDSAHTATKKKSADDLDKAPIIIKKYANRRLYDTHASCYVTLDDLAVMVEQEIEFVVHDIPTNQNITRNVLAQILFEKEQQDGDNNLLPVSFLRDLIKLYNQNMHQLFPAYLEMTMQFLKENQGTIYELFGKTLNNQAFPLSQMDNLMQESRQAWQKLFSLPYGLSLFPSYNSEKVVEEDSALSDNAMPQTNILMMMDILKKQMEMLQRSVDQHSQQITPEDDNAKS